MNQFYLWIAVLLAVIVQARIPVATFRSKTLKRVCYYVSDGHLTPNQMDATLCTHIIFGFASVVNGTIVPAHSADVQIYQDLMKLKSQDPELKVMISIGGGGGAGQLPDTARNQTKRQMFIKQALQFLKEHSFDGLDIDWEFPGWAGSPREDVQHFADLLTEFRAAVTSLKPEETKPLLSAAVSAVWTIMVVSYRVPELAKSLDFINVMCYDYYFYQASFPFAQYNSALFKRHDDVIIMDRMNINYTGYFWQKLGMPKDKIVIGIPTYGHTYKLLSADRHDLRAPATGPGSGNGWITLPEACNMLASGGKRVFDNESLVPYAYQDLNWASYDDVESFTYKAKWIVLQGYAGAMTWNLNSDDWKNSCGLGKFPLHEVIRSVFTGKKRYPGW